MIPSAYPWGKGTPAWELDATANDSDKTFTVPAGKIRVLKGVWATMLCSADVGNRVLCCVIGNGTDVLWRSENTGNIAASERVNFLLTPYGSYTPLTTHPTRLLTDTIPNVMFMQAFPCDMILPAGYTVRIYDSAAIAAGADDMTVVLHYIEYDA